MNKREKIFNKYGGRCAYCGCEIDMLTYHIDHITPKSKMTDNSDISNYNPACQDCNLYKSDLSIEDFRAKLMNDLLRSYHGRLIRKYYDMEPDVEITFYFERQ